MPKSRHPFTEHVLDLVWSLWTELGVSGWQRRHTSHAIDPEPLIIFTAVLGDADPRLRDESTDWCIKYGHSITATRLKNLLAGEPDSVRNTFGEYAATVSAHSSVRWPLATEPRRFRPTGHSSLDDFRRPSLVVLRLRALFGATARAEIVKAFLADPTAELTAADLADGVGYTRRFVSEALDALRNAGLLDVLPQRNQLRYRLARALELSSLVGQLPEYFPPWRPTFAALIRLQDIFSRAEPLKPMVRRVEIDRALRTLDVFLHDAGVGAPSTEAPEDPGTALEEWAVELARSLASGDGQAWPWFAWRRVAIPEPRGPRIGTRPRRPDVVRRGSVPLL